jgi:sugar phosphate isomerase/epimerase
MREESEGPVTPAFRLGTTSFIHRGGWLANVERLAARVEDIEILFFDADPSALPAAEEIAGLRACKVGAGLTYSVHGPLDASLASGDERRRRDSVEAVRRCIEAARPLVPEAWILHVYLGEREGDAPPADLAAWRRRAIHSLEEILRMGVDPAAVCLESLDYDFALLEPVLDALGLSAALDVGHARRDGRPVADLLGRNLHRTRVVQWHGVEPGGRDHRSLRHWPRGEALELLQALADGGYRGALTLEVFTERDLDESLAVVAELREELDCP